MNAGAGPPPRRAAAGAVLGSSNNLKRSIRYCLKPRTASGPQVQCVATVWRGTSVRVGRLTIDDRLLALVLLAVSIVCGLVFPSLAAMLQPVALPALFVVVLLSLVPFAPLATSDLVSVNRDVWRVLAWQQVVLPAIVISLGILAKVPHYVISLMIVTACSGALFASPALAALLDLDRRQALQCMVLSTLAMPISMYVFLAAVQGGDVLIDIRVYAARILIYLLLPFAIFALYRLVTPKISQAVTARVESVSKWGVVLSLSVFGIGMMQCVADRLDTHPQQVFFYFLLTTILCAGMLLVTTIVMYRYGASGALTAAIVSGFRNVGLGYALIGEMIGPELAVYVGVALLPVFTAPAILRLVAGSRRTAQPQALPQPA